MIAIPANAIAVFVFDASAEKWKLDSNMLNRDTAAPLEIADELRTVKATLHVLIVRDIIILALLATTGTVYACYRCCMMFASAVPERRAPKKQRRAEGNRVAIDDAEPAEETMSPR